MVRCVDPARDEVGDLVETLHAGLVASWMQDQPYEPAPTLRSFRAGVLTPWTGDEVRLVVAGAGVPLGFALVELPTHDNPHVGLVDLHVRQDRRR